MKFKLDCVNEQFCQLYFSLSASEVNNMFKENEYSLQRYALDNVADEDIVEAILDKLEGIIDDKFCELEVVTVGPRKTSVLTKIERNKPIMGICKTCVLPDDINISLPTYIPDELYNFKIDESSIDNFIHNSLIENGLYDLKDVDVVDDDCIVTYNLRYIKDDLILNEISDQTIDMSDDEEDIDSSKFDGKKNKDEVVIDKDDYSTIAIITRIQKKIPYELTNEVVTKFKMGIKTKKGFIDRVKSVLEFQRDVQIAMYFIVESISKTNQIEFDDVVINYLLDTFPNVNESDKDLIIASTKKMLICEYLVKVVELKTGDLEISSEELQKKIKDSSRLFFLASGRKAQSFLVTLFEDQVQQIKVLEYCRDSGLISNIKL